MAPVGGEPLALGDLRTVDAASVPPTVVTSTVGRFENRSFGGDATGRTDKYVMGGVALDYIIGKFLLAGASYSLNLNRTSGGTTGTTAGIDYTKHILLFRLGVMY